MQLELKKKDKFTKKKNFKFIKVNLTQKKIDNIFKKINPDIVLHIAGQPGVLYSFQNPKSYRLNNIDATKIISQLSKI